MANRSRRRNRRNRRRGANRKGKKMSTRIPRTAIRNNSIVSVSVPAIRDFTVYVAQPQSASNLSELYENVAAVKKVWLEALKVIGIFALKIFVTTLFASEVKLVKGLRIKADKQYITSAVQSVFIGAEDLLFTSALCETESNKVKDTIYEVPCIDYRQARMTNAIIRLTPGSEFMRRAGRYAIVCLDITEEEWVQYLPNKSNINMLRQRDNWTFQQVVQMPGAIVAPFGTPLTVTWRAHPFNYANRFLAIGQNTIDGLDFTTSLLGGKPCFRIVIAYQSFASASGNVIDTYGPNDALLQLDVRAKISLLESGRSYIRSWPLTTMDAGAVGVQNNLGNVRIDKPISEFGMVNGEIYHLEMEALSLNDLSMDG